MNRISSILLLGNLFLTAWIAFALFSQEDPTDDGKFPEIESVSAVSYTYRVELIRLIDGDTIVVDIDLGFETWLRNQKIRLYGIDAPEITGEEKLRGIAARDWLLERLEDADEIVLQSIQDKKGKFGRWLGVLYVEEVDVNEEMISAGHAVSITE